MTILGIVIAIVQLADIILHAATNQLEILRVTSNIVILAWLGVVATGKLSKRFLATAGSAIGLYVVLNVIFLAGEGITNSAQGGGLRVPLLVLMVLTAALSSVLTYQQCARG